MFDHSIIINLAPSIMFGFGITILITVSAFFLACLLGTMLAVCSYSERRGIWGLTRVIIFVTRGTPELIAIFWAYYCLPILIGLQLSGLACGVIALGVIGIGYVAEIIRAGVLAVPKGQWEAASSLGLRSTATWGLIILPQAVPKMYPALLNYFTDVLKNSTLLAGIGVGEVAYVAYLSGATTYRYLEPLTGVAVCFFLLIFPISVISRHLGLREAILSRGM